MAHMIIPHDHHSAGSEGGDKESCPVTQETQHHHPVFPGHCHAFNDLASEKFSPVILKSGSDNSFVQVIWLPEELVHGVYISKSFIHTSPVLLREIHLSELSLFRGPPPVLISWSLCA
jgi:hypothetical protein